MIEELKIIQGIIGDVSGLGAWLIGAYILYKVLVIAALTYLGQQLLSRMATLFSAGITKSEAESLRSENIRLKAEKDAEKVTHNSELERVKHMYKLLKEANENESS